MLLLWLLQYKQPQEHECKGSFFTLFEALQQKCRNARNQISRHGLLLLQRFAHLLQVIGLLCSSRQGHETFDHHGYRLGFIGQ